MNFQPISSWLENKGKPLLIAGPCGAESPEQVMSTAQGLAQLDRVSLFRAGVWKPRTRPNSFEGKGEEALLWLTEMRKTTGLPFAVEVANAAHVEKALKSNTNVVWIGARTTVNPFSVQEIADALKGVKIPVMVKNPIHADLQLWIGALERINHAGIDQLAAIHRGFHTSSRGSYRNDPMWQIPIELKTLYPELPIICDPSHISGKRELLQEVSQKALDLGMTGLMIETHCDPVQALSDAAQQITPQELGRLIDRLVLREMRSEDTGFSQDLAQLRAIIDMIDMELLEVIHKRNEVIRQIGGIKKEKGITIFQLERWQDILRTRAQWGEKLGISRQHIEKLCQLLHEESIRLQNQLMNK